MNPIAVIDDVVFGGARRRDARVERAERMNLYLDQIRAAGGAQTPEGSRIFAEMRQDPALAEVLDAASRELTPRDFHTPGEQLAVDRLQGPDYGAMKDVTSAMRNLRDSFTTDELEAGALQKDPTYQALAKMFVEMAGDGKDAPNLGGQHWTDPGMAPGPQRLADMFVPQGVEGPPAPPQRTAAQKPDMLSLGRAFLSDVAGPDGASEQQGRKDAAYQREVSNAEAAMAGQGAEPEKVTARRLSTAPESSVEAARKIDPAMVAELLAPLENRRKAVSEGKAVVDIGDGVDTTPRRLVELGFDDNEQGEFATLEKMVARQLPEGMDLRREAAKFPGSYRRLLEAIREGVPDGKGGLRKLSMNEIIKAIQSMGR